MAIDETTLLFQSHKLTAALSAKEMLLAACRADPRVFNEYVLRDEESGLPIEQAPVHDEWQVTLCQEDHAVIWSHVEAGKTNQISIGRVLWELGRNPNLRIVVLCKTELLAKKIVRAIAQYITRSPQLREVFPHLRPSTDQSEPWTQTQLTVARSNIGEKEPSVQAFGIGGALTGSRVDLAVVDDLLDHKNTRTKAQRDEVWNWLQATLQGRLTRNARVWAVGNAWHPDDAMHRLASLPRYKSFRYPVLNEKGESTWPKVWPLERIEAKRLDMIGTLDFERQLLCIVRDDNEASFKAEWVEVCLERGRGYSLVPSLFDEDGTSLLPNGFAVFHGVDLASRKSETADYTSIFTIMLWPDGTRQPLNVLTRRLNGPEIIEAIDDVHQRYGGIFMVENVAAQQYILDFAKGLTRALLRPFTTGKNKVDPTFGVASLAAEMAAGRWLIPNKKGVLHTELQAWRQEMLFFNPKDHTGDRLMASWFAREGARAYEARKRARVGNVGVRVLGADRPEPERVATT